MASLFVDVGVHVSERNSPESQLPGHATEIRNLHLAEQERPMLSQHTQPLSPFQSPLRQHQRTPSVHREVKETPNARSEYKNSQDDGRSQHHINQYIIGEEIGRGSFGAVHLAVDQYGHEYAVKEFSKNRLRRRAQSNFLRRPHAARRAGNLAADGGASSPLNRQFAPGSTGGEEEGGSLHLIKEEIAIMKKLNHPNLASLIEVLDDPGEDSLYMVLEMCKKGVIMKVGLGERADPYSAESCRYWFRDMILGIEYLHAQGVAHRDIKPDNLLLTSDDVLKVVDFGVSEMFEKESDMMTAKSAGSPAFLPPELCVVKHGDVSGRAADIWSMGVSLYCLRYGHIPFENAGVLELYEAIKKDDVDCTPVDDPNFVDLIHRILEKDAKKRITMDELREHPWVTKNGTDLLLSKEINVSNLVEPPTQTEMNHAITSNIGKLVIVIKAVNKFKMLLCKKHPERFPDLFEKHRKLVQPPAQMHESDFEAKNTPKRPQSKRQGHFETTSSTKDAGSNQETSDTPISHPNTPISEAKNPSGIQHQDVKLPVLISHHSDKADGSGVQASPQSESCLSGRGQAHDPMDEEPPWLGIGAGDRESEGSPSSESIAESPTAAEFNIYEAAYQKEVELIREARGEGAKIYLTRRIENNAEYKPNETLDDPVPADEVEGQAHESTAAWPLPHNE